MPAITSGKAIEPTRKYGLYECIVCPNDWDSTCCWPGKWQMCGLCNRKIYAYKMLPLSEIIDSSVELAPHPQALCQKCIEIGTCCENILE